MKKYEDPFVFTTGTVGYPLLFVMLMWLMFWIEFRFNLNWASFGIYPREISGLKGILLTPLIHGDLEHLFNNSVPIFVLSSFLFYFYPKQSWKVLFTGLIFTGLITWIIG